MKIGILTYHYVYNEGAIWQAYTLCKYLRSKLPNWEIEIIDYRFQPKYETLASYYSSEKKLVYEELLEDCLSREKIISSGFGELKDLVDANYDAVIVGSDIVWQHHAHQSKIRQIVSVALDNPPKLDRYSIYGSVRSLKNWIVNTCKSTSQKRKTQLDVPNAYWLPFEFSGLKASYAASVGYSSPFLPKSCSPIAKDTFSSFQFISVRDSNTKQFLSNIDPELGQKAVRVPDPAWLFNEEIPDGAEVLKKFGVPSNLPLAGLLYPQGGRHSRMLGGFLPIYMNELGFKTVSVIDNNPFVDFNIASSVLSIFDWLAVVREMDILVTVRTHPTIAALLYKTPVVNLDITAANLRSASSKSYDMMVEFGLGNFCLYKCADLKMDKIKETILHAKEYQWNWSHVDSEIQRKREISNEYIATIESAINESFAE